MTLEKLKALVYRRYNLEIRRIGMEPEILMQRLVKDKAFENYQQLTEDDACIALSAREAQGANLHGRLAQLFAYWFVTDGIAQLPDSLLPRRSIEELPRARILYTSLAKRREFGKEVTQETMQVVVENILDRYCSPEYFNPEELEAISRNDF